MTPDRRHERGPDRRAHTRGGRRTTDQRKPWYLRQRYWLAAVSLLYVGWRRVVGKGSRA